MTMNERHKHWILLPGPRLVIKGAKIPPILLMSEQEPMAVLRTLVGNSSRTLRK